MAKISELSGLGSATGLVDRLVELYGLASAGGSPGGSDTHVQYNDGGSFAGSANFTIDKTSFHLAIGGDYKKGSTTILSIAGTKNTYVGACSQSAIQNTIVGSGSGSATMVNGQNTGVGEAVLPVCTTGGANVCIGSNSGNKLTQGNSNTLLGTAAGNKLTTGSFNVLIGAQTGQALLTASYINVIGSGAMVAFQSGSECNAFGRDAQRLNVSSSYNNAFGGQSLYSSKGAGNNGFGYQAGYGISTGTYNVSFGHGAGPGSTSTMNYGIMLGFLSGYRTTSGDDNIFIGQYTGYGSSTHSCSRAIVIGHDCMRTTNPATDRLYIDTSSGVGASTLIYGEFDNRNLDINGRLATPAKTATLGVGVTAIAVGASNVMTITGDGGGNTIATITGGRDGQVLTLIFVDANVTITDDNSHASNSVDLSAAFTSADDTVLQLIYDGTSWYEISRSVN